MYSLIPSILAGLVLASPSAPPEFDAQSINSMRTHIEHLKRHERVLRTDPITGESVERVPGLRFWEAYLWYMEQRAFPNDAVDWEAYGRAVAHRDKLPAAVTDPLSHQAKWTFIGPTDLRTPYRIYWGLPPVNGRLNAAAYDPLDPNMLYVGAPLGGVWRSSDAGVTWQPLTDSWPFLSVSTIAIDPTNRDVIYVGTGDYPGYGSYSFGIMKSTDRGATWENLGAAQFGNVAVSAIAIDPDDTQNVIVTTGRGRGGNGRVWRSTNGGANWTSPIATSTTWADVAFGALAGGNRALFAVGGGTGGNVWRSMDRGATWTKLSPPLGSGSHSSMDVACSRLDPNTVYLLAPADNRICKSTNAGNSWTNITGSFPGGYNWSQGWYDYHIECGASGGQDLVYVGLIDIVVSVNGGTTWASIGGPTYSNSAITHNDQHSLAVNPHNPAQALFTNDGGAYRAAYSGSSWSITNLNKVLGVTQFYSGSVHRTNANIMLGGTQDNATPNLNNNLAQWRNVGGGDGVGCGINQQNGNIQYTGSQYYGRDSNNNIGLYRTTNNWSSSSFPQTNIGNDAIAFIPPMGIDPSQSNNVYIGTNYLYRYNEGQNSWNNRLGGTELGGGSNRTVTAISVAPSTSDVIYTGASGGAVWMSETKGASWTRINTGSPNLPARHVTSISVNPTNPYDVLVGLSGTGTKHLWRCADTRAANRNWLDSSGDGATGLPDIPLNAIARHPDRPMHWFFVGTDVGVFASYDAGQTWHNATAPLGLPNVQVNVLEFKPATGYLTAFTFGRGVWRIKPIRPLAEPSLRGRG